MLNMHWKIKVYWTRFLIDRPINKMTTWAGLKKQNEKKQKKTD